MLEGAFPNAPMFGGSESRPPRVSEGAFPNAPMFGGSESRPPRVLEGASPDAPMFGGSGEPPSDQTPLFNTANVYNTQVELTTTQSI
ncbi:hypothetical protein HRbin17_00534 [bacterium HR17]|uniref:Uncharacterized protein n=1 Tax=Candidatus Fervidibacter japonicus TaxID=2035412 RepID=A0A2H5XA30_9BACT|nr:hypothetical protein HRbin17_00534 [bacterium HR17]